MDCHSTRSLSVTETVLLCASFVVGLWLALAMPVFAQEAYYWCYAEHPDLSYFDHPPMVAWLIWLGTRVLGDGTLGFRLGTWLCGCGLTVVGLVWLRALNGDRAARSGWIVLSSGVPLYAATHFLANPDAPLAFFFAVTVWALWKARESGRLGWWVVSGLAAGGALLSKYTAGFLAVGGGLVLLIDGRMRANVRRAGPYVAVAVAIGMFLPVVVWNARHSFESFEFQTSGRWAHADLGIHWLLQYLGGQLLVFSPLLALLAPLAVAWLWQRARRRDVRALWLLAFGVPLPAFLGATSLLVQVKINWVLPAYLPLLIGILLWWREDGLAQRWPRLQRIVGSTVMIVAVGAVAAPAVRLLPQRGGSTWTGWEDIAVLAERWEEAIDVEDGCEGNMFFFGASYKDAAQLKRSLAIVVGEADGGRPGHAVEPTLAQNVLGDPGLQFDHWDPPALHIGHDAILVLARPDKRGREVAKAREHFHSIERVERIEVCRLGIPVLEADIYVCRHYTGPETH